MTWAYVGLGSNLGDSLSLFQQAVDGLSRLGEVQISRLYGSRPMGPQDQPDYVNAAVRVDTRLSPEDLLAYLQHLEQQAGRVRLRHWGERTLDLDLLCMPPYTRQTQALTIPHVGVLERAFVIQPLLDLDADLTIDGQRLSDHPLAHHQDDIHVIASATWWLAS